MKSQTFVLLLETNEACQSVARGDDHSNWVTLRKCSRSTNQIEFEIDSFDSEVSRS